MFISPASSEVYNMTKCPPVGSNSVKLHHQEKYSRVFIGASWTFFYLSPKCPPRQAADFEIIPRCTVRTAALLLKKEKTPNHVSPIAGLYSARNPTTAQERFGANDGPINLAEYATTSCDSFGLVLGFQAMIPGDSQGS
jgi:hypothetical protein